MQHRAYAAYWYEKRGWLTGPDVLFRDMIDGQGEIIVDFGSDLTLDGGGEHDSLMTPKGGVGILEEVVHRQFKLVDSTGKYYEIDTIYMNSYDEMRGVSTGAIVTLEHAQWAAIPNDPLLRVAGYSDYPNPDVSRPYLQERYIIRDEPGPSFFFSDLTFGTFVMDGARSEYTITRNDAGIVELLHTDGTLDKAAGFERIQFSDGILGFDEEGLAGQVYRMYSAAFNRKSEPGGTQYWVREMDQGNVTIQSMAHHFVSSLEFAQRFGTPENLSNLQFSEIMYTNVLGRDYDVGGLNYWTGRLDSGELSWSQMLVHFSESNENKARVHEQIIDGIWIS